MHERDTGQESEVLETEEQLVGKAQDAVSRSNWVVGECAHKWTQRYARGRTDADFAAMVGLSADQVYQRRRVWERFGAGDRNYPSLKWSHFYVVLNWDNAAECLQWAEENGATVAEMRAWQRVQRGEDLSTEPPPDPWSGDPTVTFVPDRLSEVRDPAGFGSSQSGAKSPDSSESGASGEPAETVAGVARESEGEYSPFRKGAASPGPAESPGETAVAERPEAAAERLVKRLATALERVNRSLTPEMVAAIEELPAESRRRFVEAMEELNEKAGRLL